MDFFQLLLVLLGASGAQDSVLAQSGSAWALEVNATFASRYLWRGFVLNDTPALQPSVAIQVRGLSVSSWSNLAYRGPTGQAWTEHDLTLSYSRQLNRLNLTGGYIHYSFPNIPSGGGRYTHEFFVAAGYESRFRPVLAYYRDVRLGDGDYFYLSGSHTVELARAIRASLSGGVGLNRHLWQDHTAISNCDLTVELDIPGRSARLSPFFTVSVGHRTLFGSHSVFGVKLTVLSYP